MGTENLRPDWAQMLERMRPRPDIAQAVKRMGSKGGVRRELIKLPEHLSEGETCDMILTCKYLGRKGILVLTNQRFMFLKDGVKFSKSKDFPLKIVSSIQFTKGLFGAVITISAVGVNKTHITNTVNDQGQEFVDIVRQRISAGITAPAQVATSRAPDSLDQLKKLAELRDSGVLTDEEFAVQKAKILGS